MSNTYSAEAGVLHADARTHRFAPLRFDVIVNQLGVSSFANLAGALRRAVAWSL
jgi:hypothetical protein